jgi:DNA-binding LacI/PurR family transcriptional regulator
MPYPASNRMKRTNIPTQASDATPSQRRVTLRDVAKRVGVSHATVSMCFHNAPSIPEKRRKQVLRVAEQMGYRPDPVLSALAEYRRRNRPQPIQSALAWLNRWEQPEKLRQYNEFNLYWLGASQAAERFGYHLEEIRWLADLSPKRIEQILLTRNIRGLLIPPHASVLEWGNFDWSKFSIIRFGMSVSKPNSNLVTADQQRAVLMAFEKIKQYGYKRIGLVTGRDYDSKLGGNFIGGLAAAQELFNFEHILPPLLTTERIYLENREMAKRALGQWMKRHHPDAVLTTEIMVPDLIRELGYRIPEDIAVAGSSCDIPVDAGINQNSENIGRIAVEMLVAQIKMNVCGEPASPCRILVESCWQDGKSLPPHIRP